MEIVTATLLMIVLFYQFYAVPLGVLFIFLLTRRLLKRL